MQSEQCDLHLYLLQITGDAQIQQKVNWTEQIECFFLELIQYQKT